MTGTVLVTSRSFSSGDADLVGRLGAAGLVVERAGPEHDLSSLAGPLSRALAWISGTGPVTAQHLELAPHLRVVARYGVGMDAVDLAAAAQAGVVVTNTPGANSEAVAEHTIALLLAVLRAVPSGDARVRAGDWSVTRGRQLAGAVTGVVGLGRIGRATARRLIGLGCQVLAHDPHLADEVVAGTGCRPAALDRIRHDCAVVTLHAPGGTTLVDDAWTEHCAPGQVVVNTARADLVEEDAVAGALRSGRLSGYAADTLRAESAGASGSPLLAADLRDRVVVTPHLGAQTTESVDQMGGMAVDDVLAVLAGRPPQHPVLPVPVQQGS